MSETKQAADARVLAQHAELARERHDFLKAISLFNEALHAIELQTTKSTEHRALKRWCLAHRGAAQGASGAFRTGLDDLNQAAASFEESEVRDATTAAGRAYTWTLAQKGELHRLCASSDATPTRGVRAYSEQIVASADALRQAHAREPNNAWISIHLAGTATLAYWNAFSCQEWGVAIRDAKLEDRAQIRALFDRGLAARPNDWWARMFQVIYYIVEYPVDFRQAFASKESHGKQLRDWTQSMNLWWNNYEYAMDLSKNLEQLGMRPYAAQSGRAVATAYGLTWHDAVLRNLTGLEQHLDGVGLKLLQRAQSDRSRYLDEAMTCGLDLLRYSPEDMFGNMVIGAVLRSQAELAAAPPTTADASAYLDTLRKLSASQTFITDMVRRSTLKAFKIREGLSEPQRAEFDKLHKLNQDIWALIDTGNGKKEPGQHGFEHATPYVHSGEQAVMQNLLFPGLQAILASEKS
ncbi:MAG: hypothetical protein RL701_1203 [Pseudomonadota bacterium]|jgi:hypothetical protein